MREVVRWLDGDTFPSVDELDAIRRRRRSFKCDDGDEGITQRAYRQGNPRFWARNLLISFAIYKKGCDEVVACVANTSNKSREND